MNWWGIVVSFGLVFGFIGVAGLLLRAGRMSPALTRKAVHIGVAHWWILAMIFFDRWEFAIVGPAAFILINLASYLFRLFPAMEHEKRSRNLGTVYFPVALLACVLLTWAGPVPIWVGGLAILVLGWGDGLASVVGERRRSGSLTVLGNRKSIAGTVTMFVASTVVITVFVLLFLAPGPLAHTASASVTWLAAGDPAVSTLVVRILATALLATLVELVTPFGLDNLSVPLVTILFFHLV
ncbi:MAG: diacylglycerol/polyprenol kinase family protein [Spirochaetota bacterium]